MNTGNSPHLFFLQIALNPQALAMQANIRKILFPANFDLI